MRTVYVLWSRKDRELYIGVSRDIKRRLKEHTEGRVSATRYRRPLILIFCESFRHDRDATARERYLKTGWGRKHLQKALQHTLSELNKN